MTQMPQILADSDTGTIIKIVFIVAVIVLSILSKLGKKTQDRRAQDAAKRKAEQARSPARVGRPVQPGGTRPEVLEPLTPPPIPQIPPRRIARRPTAAAEADIHVRTIREPVDLDTVDEEVDRMRHELDEKVAVRRHRMETAAPTEADTAAIDARISHFQRMEVQADQIFRVQVDLNNPAAFRAAIVYHEIMSQPKALREGPELWDQ